MKPYANRLGNSGITAYEIGPDSIAVLFANGTVYVYTYGSTGREEVEQMKSLAEQGQGLSTFISQHVKERFAHKLR